MNAIRYIFARRLFGRDNYTVFAEQMTFGERLADRVAAIGGSWGFIFSFSLLMIAWATVNIGLGTKAFDPFPFIFLNLMLSMVAALQAPVIMMSQNRQAAKDRLEARLDYETNVRTEIQIEGLHAKIDALTQQLELMGRQRGNVSRNAATSARSTDLSR